MHPVTPSYADTASARVEQRALRPSVPSGRGCPCASDLRIPAAVGHCGPRSLVSVADSARTPFGRWRALACEATVAIAARTPLAKPQSPLQRTRLLRSHGGHCSEHAFWPRTLVTHHRVAAVQQQQPRNRPKIATWPLRALRASLARFRCSRLCWTCYRQTRVSARARGLYGALAFLACAGTYGQLTGGPKPENSSGIEIRCCRLRTLGRLL